jgi:amino acid transporter
MGGAPSATGAAVQGEASLVRVLGTWGLAASIVNVTVGGGIFRLPATVAQQLGTSAPLAYLVCALAMGLIVLCFAEAGSRVAMTGGPYAYLEVAFGPFVGFLGGVLLWLLGTFALSAVSTIFADSAGALVPALARDGARAAFLVAVFALLAGVNILGVRQGTRLNTVATIAKLLPLLLLVGAGLLLAMGDRPPVAQLAPAADLGRDLARASITLIFAFSGIESALVPSGEVREPARTVPRAIGIAMLGITVLYVVLHMVAQGTLGTALATSPTPLADAAGALMGPWGRTLILVGAVVSMFGYVSGMTLAVPRALYAFARDGFLPRVVGSIHPRFRTPWVAIALQSAIACALAISGEFAKLAILANISTLLLYGACCVAAWQLRRRGVQAGGTPFRVPAAGVVPWVACLVIAFMFTSVTRDEWLVVGGVLAASAVVFALVRRGGRAAAVEAAR